MLLKRKFEIFLLFLFFIFSIWLMNKSFGYDSSNHRFRIARHEVGDFGLHLSLIRSFSWGDNFPAQSPFFPGKPLPYHYFFDLLVGLLERIGVRIDIAFNGLSVFFLTVLLFLIYKLPQLIFGKSRFLGILSVVLFVFHSSMTFLDFLKGKSFNFSLLNDLWHLPDYISKGPYDNSIISIFFTFNVFLNQRHLIAALAINSFIFYFILKWVLSKKENLFIVFLLGILLGISSRFQSLIFLGSIIVLFFLITVFKRYRLLFYLFIPAFIIFSFHLKDIINQNLSHQFINLGFLASRPLTLSSFLNYWFLNLGLSFFLIPLGFLISSVKEKKIFLSFLPLFIVGNLFQLGFGIETNHSLFNFFIIFANFYIAFLLLKMWRNKLLLKIFFVISLLLLTASGFIDLMPVKNDFQYPLYDAPSNKFMNWIKNNTEKNDIFLSREEIFDPITLSGRKNYFGHTYYLRAMGFNFSKRQYLAKNFFEAKNIPTLDEMREEKIKYLVIPNYKITDFNYSLNIDFLNKNLESVYFDKEVNVFKL